jgi:Spy/CpxP family protein refolding chaperone
MNIARNAAALIAAAITAVVPAIASDIATGEDTDYAGRAEVVAHLPSSSRPDIGGDRIKLTDEQLEKLHALRAELSNQAQPKLLELKTLKRQLKDELTKASLDKQQVLSLQGKINAIRADLANARVAMAVDANAIFTAEQKQQMRRRYLMGGRKGGFMHGRRGHCSDKFGARCS